MEVGAEKLATLSDRAYAYNADGEVAKVDLDDIYALVAAKLSMAPADVGLISYTDLPASHGSNSPSQDTSGS